MNVLSIVSIALVIIAAVGGAAGYFKASRGETIIKLLTTENDSLRRQLSDAEKMVEKFRTEGAAKDSIISEKETHIVYLKEMLQGSPELFKKLAKKIDNLITSMEKKGTA